MKLFYRKFGDGPPLIIVHGLYGASDNWVTVGKELANNFEVFIIDQRNHGRSPHSADHTYELMVQDLYNFMEVHHIEKAVLLGHSMGGKTVMYFALQNPERISSLIVVDIAPKSYNNQEQSHLTTINHPMIISAMKSVDFSKVNKREDAYDQLAKKIHSEKVCQFLLKNLHRNKDNTFKWSLNLDALIKDMSLILEGLEKKHFVNGKEVTGFPILFVKGGLSEYIKEEDKLLIRSFFPYADFKTIPNTGHWLHAEEPALLTEVIKEFVLD